MPAMTAHKAWASAITGAIGSVLAAIVAWLQVTDLSTLTAKEIAIGLGMAVLSAIAGGGVTYQISNRPKGDPGANAGADRN